MTDTAEPGADEMAAWLRDQSAKLAAAADRAGEVTCAATRPAGDAQVKVQATGAGRVSRVTIEPAALSASHAELGDALARAVNEAVSAARGSAAEAMAEAAGPGQGQALLQSYAPPAAEAGRFTDSLAGELVRASSPGGEVTVIASGTGEISAVEIAPHEGQEPDADALGSWVEAAANGALDAARRVQHQLLDPSRDDGAGLAARSDALVTDHTRQMSRLLDDLAETERQIDRW